MGTHPIFEYDFDCLTEKKSKMDSHGAIVLNLLNKQRQETSDPKLTDTTLKPTLDPQKRNLRCHRCLLSLNPNIFKLLTTRDGEGYAEIELKYETLDALLTFMYTGDCEFSQNNVIDIVSAAGQFSMERLRTKAQEYLNRLANPAPTQQPVT